MQQTKINLNYTKENSLSAQQAVVVQIPCVDTLNVQMALS